MPRMTGRRAFLELLKQEGVEYIFGNPGTTELPLMDELAAETDITYVLGLQEAPVMAIADGYAQASGRLAAVNLHAAPGLGNALGMLYDAQKAGSPVIVTAGQHELNFTLTEPLLWADLPTIARPFVKWATEVARFEDLPMAVHRAAKVALTPPMGPVFLSIPGDILTAEGEIDLGGPTRVAPRLQGDADAIAQAAELIAASERPVLIAGDAVAQSGALDEVTALAEALGAGVYLEGLSSRASFPTDHPQCIGSIGRLAASIREKLSAYDLIVSIGGDLCTLSLPPPVRPIPDGMKIVHLDNDAWELGKNYQADVAILADPKVAVPALLEAVRGRMDAARVAAATARRDEVADAVRALRRKLADDAARQSSLVPLHPTPVLTTVAKAITKETIVVEEGLSSTNQIREIIRSGEPGSFYGMRGGGIGWGLSAAVGVKLAQPSRPVVAVIGDGSALYTCQALWTAVHHRPGGLVFLILNNGGYRIIKQRTRALRGFAEQYGRYVGMDFGERGIDFLALAKAFGMQATEVTTLEDLERQITIGLTASEPILLDVKMDREL